MTIAQTRRWLVGMAPDQIAGRRWVACRPVPEADDILRVLAADRTGVQTTSGRMTWGGLAHRLVRGDYCDG